MGDSLDSPEAEALPDIEDLRESLKAIVTQSMRVREITRKLLMAGVGLDPRSAPMDVQAVVSRVLTLLQGRMDSLKVTCRLHFPPEWGEDAPRPLGSALELEQICLHLVENALDAMPEGGTLDIGARLLPADDDGTTWYELSVADSGTGIADDIMPHIFEPFFTTHRQAGRAAGLGLSVCTGLAHGRGGQITAANRPEGGALFRLLLPLPVSESRSEGNSECLPHRIFPQGPLSGPRPLRRPQRSATPTHSPCRPFGPAGTVFYDCPARLSAALTDPEKRLSSRCVVCPHPVDSGKSPAGIFFLFKRPQGCYTSAACGAHPALRGLFSILFLRAPCPPPRAAPFPQQRPVMAEGRPMSSLPCIVLVGRPQRGQVHSVQPPDPQQPRHHP